VISVAGAPGSRQAVEDKINDRMKAFAAAYSVRWTDRP